MIVFLNILKIIGIILLCILGLILLLLLLVLFVPIRYRVKTIRKLTDDAAVRANVKITWLLHAVSVSFRYPEAAYVKVCILGISVYSTGKKENGENRKTKEAVNDTSNDRVDETIQNTIEEKVVSEKIKQEDENKNIDIAERIDENLEEMLEYKLNQEEEDPTIIRFFKKLIQKLKNIKYTILQICDKIKHVISNIRYYLAVIQSNCFKRAFSLCKTEVFSLIKSILPRRIKGTFLVGTGDPASTAQILAVHGMLYPIIGNHITITLDFENAVIEGDLLVKGRITVFKALKTAIKVYFNKDVRKVLRLLKREAA